MTVSYIFKYRETPLWDEFLDDESSILGFPEWLHQVKAPDALSVFRDARQQEEGNCEIIFMNEKDLTFFLLTL